MPPRSPREPTRGTSAACPPESSACAAASASRSASRSSSSSTSLRFRTSIAVLTVLLPDERERPVRTMLRVEREEEDPLPLAEAESSVGERHLLRARAEQEREQALARAQLPGHDALEQLLEVLEETRLALLHAEERERARAMEVGDARADARLGDLARDVVRDVHYRQRREGRGDRVWDFDGRHACATSLGSLKWTSSFATSISSGSA